MAEKLPQKLELGVAEVKRNLGKLLGELSQKVGAEASKQGLTPEQLLEEIDETRKTLFCEDYAELA